MVFGLRLPLRLEEELVPELELDEERLLELVLLAEPLLEFELGGGDGGLGGDDETAVADKLDSLTC